MKTPSFPPTAGAGSGTIRSTDMGAAMRLAEMMSTGRPCPARHLQKSPGDCLMVVELAMRFCAYPRSPSRNAPSVIQGKLMLEGKHMRPPRSTQARVQAGGDRLANGVNDTARSPSRAPCAARPARGK